MTPYYVPTIENGPVSQRRKELTTQKTLLVVATSVSVIIGFIYSITLRAETVRDDYRTQQLMRLREQLEREKQQLKLQQAHLRSPQAIEPLARSLGLVRPDSSQVIVANTIGELKQWRPVRKLVSRKEKIIRRPSSVARSPWQRANNGGPRGTDDGSLAAWAVQTRPKRVEIAKTGEPKQIPKANAEPKMPVDETPRFRPRGVLNVTEEHAEPEFARAEQR